MDGCARASNFAETWGFHEATHLQWGSVSSVAELGLRRSWKIHTIKHNHDANCFFSADFAVSVSIGTGATQQFVATAHLSDGTTSDMSSSVTWSSSDASVAGVSTKGLANGAAVGTVTISAQMGSI